MDLLKPNQADWICYYSDKISEKQFILEFKIKSKIDFGQLLASKLK